MCVGDLAYQIRGKLSRSIVQGGSVPPKAIVEFENGMRLMVDERMKWERVDEAG